MVDVSTGAARMRTLVPGLSAASAIAVAAVICGLRFPLVGAPVFALAIGIAVAARGRASAVRQPGLAFASRTLLQVAIVVSGFGLSFASVIRTGTGTLPVMLVTIAVALVLGPIAGRALRLERSTVILVSVGTAICGASAIGSVAAVLDSPEEDVALGIAVIFCYNVIAAFAFPIIGHELHLSQQAFGIWAGTAINDTSSVIAAGYAYGQTAGSEATIVKLTRSVFILPIVAALVVDRAYRRQSEQRVRWKGIVPWFIGWFILATLTNTLGFLPAGSQAVTKVIAVVLISMALASIGLQTNITSVLRTGWRPLALGLFLWISVAITSLVVQRATGM